MTDTPKRFYLALLLEQVSESKLKRKGMKLKRTGPTYKRVGLAMLFAHAMEVNDKEYVDFEIV